ncbi:MAG: tetratricopeptide repeat protein [Gammaproteobacteria bacterium]|nr:tetratricopeptide repeat protein [Gammaproteobacteria bacterium]
MVQRWWPAFLVVLLVGLAYANGLQASFQFDDWEVIVRDLRVQSVAAWWASMPGMRPLLKLSYALNHESGAGVTGFHVLNVVVHAGNGLLILFLVRQFAAQLGEPPARAGWLALATALIFVLHPVQTEAVTYASGRSTSLSALFALGSIAVWVQGREVADWRASRLVLLYLVSPVLMLAAIATKETMAIVPAVLLLWEAADVSRPFNWRNVLARTGLHWLVVVGALLAVLSLPVYRDLLASSLATRSVAGNLVAQLQGIRYLAGQLLNIDRMNADPALPAVVELDVEGSVTMVVLVVAGGLALTSVRRYPIPAFAVLWFLLWLSPTNSLLARLDVVNDRQLYVALAGPALLLAAAVRRLAARQPGLALAALMAVLGLTGVATHLRNEVYRDEVSFWRDVVGRSPHNARAFNNLGIALAGECDLRRAEDAWRRALVVDPGYTRAAVNLRLLTEGVLPAGVGPCHVSR